MGLYKRPDSAVWWCRFQVAGHEIKRSTRTEDRRAAAVEERRLRSYFESKAPRRRSRGRLTLADLGAKDCARAAAEGATQAHVDALESQWIFICKHFGADSSASVLNHDSVNDYVVCRRRMGATGQTVVREVQAMKRACAIAHRTGHLPVIPQTWPRIRRDATSKRKGRLHPPQILSQWLAELPADARDEAELAVLTGLRAHELKRVTAQWVEPAPPELRAIGVPTVLRVPATAAKARRERVVPLVAAALAIIKRRVDHMEIKDAPILRQGSHKTAHRLARGRIGYRTPISLRDLRHTFGTLANRAVGIDAARDGLGHATLATTNRYVSGDITRTAEATLAIAALVGTVRSAQSPEGLKMERAKRLELSTLSLGSQLLTALEHASTCKRCCERLLACAKLQAIPEDVGTVGSAQPTRKRGSS